VNFGEFAGILWYESFFFAEFFEITRQKEESRAACAVCEIELHWGPGLVTSSSKEACGHLE
jgi:hypothetical protein